MRPTVLMRRPGPDLVAGLTLAARRAPSPERALAQHGALAAALRVAGAEVEVLPALPGAPDACFVEDRVVAFGGRALLTRSAVPSRAGEGASLRAPVAAHADVHRMEDGCLDGGDVLRLGDRLLVGLSRRTDADGVAWLRRVFGPVGLRVETVEVGDDLHLKCAATSPLPGLVVVSEDSPVRERVGADHAVVVLPREEAYAANCVGVGSTVVVAAGFPGVRAQLEARGLRVVALDTSEFRCVDGSLTCLTVAFAGT